LKAIKQKSINKTIAKEQLLLLLIQVTPIPNKQKGKKKS
jgi:hypothetical protein